MPCVSPTQIGHREKHDVPSVPVECACAPLGMDEPEVGVRVRTPLGVTKLLDYRETRTNPRAIEAVKAEVEALASRGTWDTEEVQEKEAVVEWAKRTGTKVHIGEGLGICSIKHHEMPEAMQKWKGRFCYRAPTVRDEGGALAIFQEMSSRPTTIVSVNVAIAYGCLKGHSVTAADAVKAYVQSDLNAKHPTFIEIPRHLCPAKWAHLRKPCFRLKKALYGHPEAGGHWERHLTKIVLQLGGKPVPAHPSCFWFPQTGLLLVVYVDDLLLAGPTHEQDGFWQALRKQVDTEPPEDLDRYLGRHHSFADCRRLPPDANLLNVFQSPILA